MIPVTVVSNENVSAVSGTANGGKIRDVSLKLFGRIPIKQTRVQSIDQTSVIPGGRPFGIKMFSKGVMVVGLSDIETDSGSVCPGKDAGIRLGDIIYSINGISVSTNEEVERLISTGGGNPLTLLIRQGNDEYDLTLTPVLAKATGDYKAGIWVRDSSAGIGTITFYHPGEGVFAGLGHAICDVDTGEIIPLLTGETVKVNINSVQKGTLGSPGELRGNFSSERATGNILLNNETGVYGQMYEYKSDLIPIPIALKQQIKTGPAKILSTIEGLEPREYDIVIEKVSTNDSTLTKNMVIRVTDPELLEKTGGIVQGMSGSPILQEGTLVGAVTHVFVNDPAKGYGIFAENMIANIDSMAIDTVKKAG
ncbi:MAG: SpoIVB peptidase [Oscillospiraceae bacterium]|nr:SpoIVB peptidase [Oscillospiraceae bacterium]